MRVKPSHPDNLFSNGVSIRVYFDTRAKIRELAAIRGKTHAALLDELVDAALQRAYDEREAATHPTQETEE